MWGLGDEDDISLLCPMEECSFWGRSEFWLVIFEPQNFSAAVKLQPAEIFPPPDWIYCRAESCFLFGSDFYIHLNLHRLWTCCSFIFPMISTAASVFWEITFSLFGSAVKEITVFQHVEEQICSPLACVFRLDRCYVDDNTHSMPPFVNSEVTVRLSVLT